MKLIDIHSHMDFKQFDNDRESIIEEMKKNNIITLTNTLNEQNYEYTKKLFKNNSNTVKVCPGLYPVDAQNLSESDFNNYLLKIERIKDLVAIGEVGLDLMHGSTPEEFEIQITKFKKLIELGIKLNKPIIIHTWGAENKVLEILEEYINKTGFTKFILHCFTGKKKLIKKIKELKIYASVPLTVLNNQGFQILVEELPMSKLLVETDSPYLNPQKERNSPLNIPQIYEKIASIKGYDIKEVENMIFRNYQKLFM